MSGVSLAVGPRDEPDKTTTTLQKTEQKPPLNQRQQQSVGGDVLGSLRVIELQLVAFIMVFSASGLVPLLDLVFPAFASAYLLALSRLAFPAHGRSSPVSQELFQSSKFFRFSVILGATVGLFLPLAYVLGGFARGDEHAVRSATPHLFLLSFQILTENVISRLSLFSPPVRALVPLLYTVRRIFLIIDWITDVWFNKTLPSNMEVKDMAWHWFGRILAAANLLYLAINLFCFLIPRFLPRAFEKYFRERDEIQGKRAEDKRSATAGKSESIPTDKKAD
ncbi:Transmembrane protein [Melia azedarach]|uniref:Transmembrane protein n=1 Tax=Melia azedarach TaxID=155640 RepID=A0ACC1XHY2_MELAZ|nr:Transmembrane protein [Melia azedarach]